MRDELIIQSSQWEMTQSQEEKRIILYLKSRQQRQSHRNGLMVGEYEFFTIG